MHTGNERGSCCRRRNGPTDALATRRGRGACSVRGDDVDGRPRATSIIGERVMPPSAWLERSVAALGCSRLKDSARLPSDAWSSGNWLARKMGTAVLRLEGDCRSVPSSMECDQVCSRTARSPSRSAFHVDGQRWYHELASESLRVPLLNGTGTPKACRIAGCLRESDLIAVAARCRGEDGFGPAGGRS